MALRIRRGLDIERQSIIPAEGEPLYCTDTGMLYIGDGSTIGGNLVTGIKSLLDDPTPALSANLDLNSNNIVGMGNINIVGDLTVSGNLNIDAVKADYRGSLFGDDSTLIVNGFDHTVHASVIGKDGNKLVDTETGEINLQNTSFNNFSDLDTLDAVIGDGLFFDGSTWVAKPFGADGTDNPPNGSILQWVSGGGWMAQSFIMAADSSPMMNFDTGEIFLGQTNLESIRNVFIDPNTIQPDEVLVWDGLNWTHKEIDASNLALTSFDLDSIEGVYVPVPSIDDLFYFDGNNWINKPGTIDILKDVAIDGPQNNQYLRFDGFNWINDYVTLNNVDECVIDGPQNNQYLRFDGFNWVNDYVTFNHVEGCVILQDPVEYDILLHDGYNWTNQTLMLNALSDVNVSTTPLSEPSALVYDDGIWTDKPFDLSSLSDVNIPTTLNSPVILKYDPTTNEWKGEIFDLNAITNVEAPAPFHGDTLIWNSTNNAWQADEFLLNSLKDVEIDTTSLNDGHILTWNGIAWESAAPDTVLDIERTDLQPGDFLIWNGTHFVNQQFGPLGTDMYQGSVLSEDSTIMIDAITSSIYANEITATGITTNEITANVTTSPKLNMNIDETDDNVMISYQKTYSSEVTNFQFLHVQKFGYTDPVNSVDVNEIVSNTDGFFIFSGGSATDPLYPGGVPSRDKVISIQSGKLGIHKFSPSEALDVRGNIKTSGFIQFGSYTTIERDDLTTTNTPQYATNFGMVIYNTDANKFQGWQNTGGTTPEWVDLS